MNKLKKSAKWNECPCDCEFQRNWPFITSYCVHGKRLIPDIPIVKPIIGNTVQSTKWILPDSVMNIIRGNNK